jgi:tRNA pseudouridine38-40 synthase
VRAIASGRTDAGVHALGQVAAFRTDTHLPADVLRRALNAELPPDVAVLGAADAPEGFHPIRDAVRKRYRYVIHDGPVRDVFRRRYCWQYPSPLDHAAMARAAGALVGTHDFSSFETSGAARKDSIRTIHELTVERGRGGDEFNVERARRDEPQIEQGRDDDTHWITVEVEADGFLYNMVRAIVGTLVEVGRGAEGESWVAQVLAAADRTKAGPTAPPQGLFLVRVEYEGRD